MWRGYETPSALPWWDGKNSVDRHVTPTVLLDRFHCRILNRRLPDGRYLACVHGFGFSGRFPISIQPTNNALSRLTYENVWRQIFIRWLSDWSTLQTLYCLSTKKIWFRLPFPSSLWLRPRIYGLSRFPASVLPKSVVPLYFLHTSSNRMCRGPNGGLRGQCIWNAVG